MRLPNEERFAIITTISRVEAKKVLERRAEQGWKLIGFATRGNELVMVFERENIEYLRLSNKHLTKEEKAANRRLKWLGLKRLVKGGRGDGN